MRRWNLNVHNRQQVDYAELREKEQIVGRDIFERLPTNFREVVFGRCRNNKRLFADSAELRKTNKRTPYLAAGFFIYSQNFENKAVWINQDYLLKKNLLERTFS